MGNSQISRFRKAVSLAAFLCVLSACSEAPSDGLDSGGVEPPPGFLIRTDSNCRAAALDNDLIGALTDTAPTIRQLNGQSLFGYATVDDRGVQCVVRHADEGVSDIRVIGAE